MFKKLCTYYNRKKVKKITGAAAASSKKRKSGASEIYEMQKGEACKDTNKGQAI